MSKNVKLYFSELIGTFTFVSIGLGSVATMVLGLSDLSYSFMALAWGIAIALAIYITGSISGAHMNPAVTLAMVVWDRFDKKKAVGYIVAQILGAFLSAALVYLIFADRIVAFEEANGWIRGNPAETGAMGIFVTSPAAGVSMWKAFLVETINTMVLVLTIFAVTDPDNASAPDPGVAAIVIGISVTLCGLAFGPLTGFAMNTARDLGPRLFLMIAGWGTSALGSNLYGLIVPVFAPITGGLISGGIYKKVIVKMRHQMKIEQ